MPTIYLIRHGQKHSSAGDPGLTEIGIKQAQQTGEYLKQFPISKIISSPFKRTSETALHIGNALNVPFDQHPALMERMNWNGDGVSRSEFFLEWIKSTHDREYTPKYGDSSKSTGDRVQELIDSTLKDSDTAHIVLVSHGGAILDYVRNMFGDDQVSVLKTQYPEGYDYQMYNCAITKVVIGDSPLLELLNFTDHLSEMTE